MILKSKKDGIDLHRAIKFVAAFNIKMEISGGEDQDLFER